MSGYDFSCGLAVGILAGAGLVSFGVVARTMRAMLRATASLRTGEVLMFHLEMTKDNADDGGGGGDVDCTCPDTPAYNYREN